MLTLFFSSVYNLQNLQIFESTFQRQICEDTHNYLTFQIKYSVRPKSELVHLLHKTKIISIEYTPTKGQK